MFRLRRDTGDPDGTRTSKEIIHGIVSLTADQASPAHLNHCARGHWIVELAINTFRLAGRTNIAHARRDLHDRTDTFAVYGN